jgi:hypothetical protein
MNGTTEQKTAPAPEGAEQEPAAPAVFSAEQLAANPFLARADISDAEKVRFLAEVQSLRAVSQKIAGLENSLWQPDCVSAMFANDDRAETDPVFTMQAWINLDRARSPLLYGKLPNEWHGAKAAFRAFGFDLVEYIEGQECPEEEVSAAVATVLEKMNKAIKAGFAMAVSMDPPHVEGMKYESHRNEFGSYLSLWACLVKQCHVLPECADMLEVGRARALVAAMRGNEGWTVSDTPYAIRGAGGEKQEEEEAPEVSGADTTEEPANG